jgi:hypothetical protein
MKPFNRERFLLCLLAGILSWQAGIFTFALVKCAQKGDSVRQVCPMIGDRYETFVNTSLGAVLGLLAGGAVGASTRRSRDD